MSAPYAFKRLLHIYRPLLSMSRSHWSLNTISICKCTLPLASAQFQFTHTRQYRRYHNFLNGHRYISILPLNYSHQHRHLFTTDLHSVNSQTWTKTHLHASDSDTETVMKTNMLVYEDFLEPSEEDSIMDEIEPYMRRLRYEYDHWDNAIHGFRETERMKWSEKNQIILNRVRDLAFPPSVAQLAYVHILDLAKDGYIKPHIDSTRFCGSTIAGLSLLSPCIMRLVHDKEKSKYADVLLKQRSLYIMKGSARYDYTHEVLDMKNSVFHGTEIKRDRRISVICRNEPSPDDS